MLFPLEKKHQALRSAMTKRNYLPVCFMENRQYWLTLTLLNFMTTASTLHNIFWWIILVCWYKIFSVYS